MYAIRSYYVLALYGISAPATRMAASADEAVQAACAIGYPVVLKVVSPDAVHKSEAGGVMVGLQSNDDVARAYGTIRSNLSAYKPGAFLQGVRVMKMVGSGYDMYVGGRADDAFGPVVFFGYGGIYVEIFNDTDRALCPASHTEISYNFV